MPFSSVYYILSPQFQLCLPIFLQSSRHLNLGLFTCPLTSSFFFIKHPFLSILIKYPKHFPFYVYYYIWIFVIPVFLDFPVTMFCKVVHIGIFLNSLLSHTFNFLISESFKVCVALLNQHTPWVMGFLSRIDPIPPINAYF